MAKTSLIVKALDSNGKLLQKTVTDVNPEATNETLAAFGQKVNALTTHTYSGTDRVDKINCDTEVTPVDTRPTPTIELTPSGITLDNYKSVLSAGNRTYDINVETNSDGTAHISTPQYIYGTIKPSTTTGITFFASLYTPVNDLNSLVTPLTVTVTIDETENFKGVSYTLVFN